MWLYQHHTCSDLIDLDPDTGRWRHVQDEEKPKGARVLADLPVKGSYLQETDKRYYSYWTDDGRFVFSTSDGCAIEICRKHADGRIEMLVPGLHCDITPTKLSDGRLRPGYSDVSLKDGAGTTLCALTYHSTYYARLFNSDITASAMVQDLSDWDFFVALQGGIEIFTERAKSGRLQLTVDADQGAVIDGRRLSGDELIYGSSGDLCVKSGVWAAVDDLRETAAVKAGDHLPLCQGRATQWVWSRER